ncbi:unnamed protein product [Strongylus vulgaris]|uniref:Uncharacterized protein n=1 Tax=Strongylus vulgaris TaxID=40348 RepID=A0A3P7ICD3_STRVU|nr:unnamed protein product [Strongylus vulgaris]
MNEKEGSSVAAMAGFYYLFGILFLLAHRSHASFPAELETEESAGSAVGDSHVPVQPLPTAQVVASAPIANVAPAVASASVAHVAPAMPTAAVPGAVAPASALLPPQPYPIIPYASNYPLYYPLTALRNVKKTYVKESGHSSQTDIVSEGGHLSKSFGFHPFGKIPDAVASPELMRSRASKKLASKKTLRAHKKFDKKKN